MWITFPEDTEWTKEESALLDEWSKSREVIEVIASFEWSLMDKTTKETIRHVLLDSYNRRKNNIYSNINWPDIDINHNLVQ